MVGKVERGSLGEPVCANRYRVDVVAGACELRTRDHELHAGSREPRRPDQRHTALVSPFEVMHADVAEIDEMPMLLVDLLEALPRFLGELAVGRRVLERVLE